MIIRLLSSTALSHVKHWSVLYQSLPFTLPSLIFKLFDANRYQVYCVYSTYIQSARYFKKCSTGWSLARSTSNIEYEFNSNAQSLSGHLMQNTVPSNTAFCHLSYNHPAMLYRPVSNTHQAVLQLQTGDLFLILFFCSRYFNSHNNSNKINDFIF